MNNPDSNPGDSNFVLDFGTSYRGIMSPGSQLVADSIRADEAQDIIYKLFANTLNPSFGATVLDPNPATPTENYPFTTPIIAAGLLPTLPFTSQATLAGFQGMAGPNYVDPFRVWDFTAIGRNVTFQVTDKSVLNVDVHFNPNDNFKFGIGTNAGAQLNIGAQTSDYDNGGPERVTSFSHDATIYAQYFSPTGWLDLGGENSLYGRYWA